VYWQYWLSKLDHLFYARPHFQILTDATGWKITTTYTLHHSRQRSIPLDNFSNEDPWVPCQFSKINGRGVTKHFKWHRLHWWPTGSHTNTWRHWKVLKVIKVLEQVLEQLHSHNLKINLDKGYFDKKEVSYLGFTLTPEGIKPGRNKLKAINPLWASATFSGCT
jgi:hypothetical protein